MRDMNANLFEAKTHTLPQLWNQKQLAEYLGKSTAWCERARWAGDGPKFIKLGRHVRYRVEDVHAWIDEHSARVA
jgi:predicted DNA-binding transcriptional regulator AlpA